MSNIPRIFLGAQEIAGMMDRLNRAYKAMGYYSDFFCMYNYKNDDINDPVVLKGYRKHTQQLRNTKNKILKSWLYILQMFDILFVLNYCIKNYDYFVYIFGHGMFITNRYLKHFQELEFKLLKLKNKKIIMWFCGDDSRAPYCGSDIFNGDYQKMMQNVQYKKKNIQMLEKYALLIDFTASSHFHNVPYVIYNCLSVPVDSNEIVTKTSQRSDKITILHAPSVKAVKGTAEIRNIIAEIESEGYDINYIEVSGMPHNTVLEKMAEADIVIDQMYSDTPMAGFAAEASVNGIPVIVGGYYSEYYKDNLIDPIPPTVYCNPDDVKTKLIELINSENLRDSVGRAEYEYIQNNSLSENVAKKFLSLFDNTYPKEWLYSPQKNEYIWGLGNKKSKVIENVYNLVEKYGMESLGLKENSVLYQKYKELYEQEKKNRLNK